MTALFTAVFSVVPTRRRRFFWAAWWKGPPEAEPFRPPDACNGGARTREEARAEAERAAARPLVETDGRWAGAWVRVLRGDPPWPKPRDPRPDGAPGPSPRVSAPPPAGSKPWALALLGLPAGAAPDEIRRAFRALALRSHPDQGGDTTTFIEAKRAYDVAMSAAESTPRRRRARR